MVQARINTLTQNIAESKANLAKQSEDSAGFHGISAAIEVMEVELGELLPVAESEPTIEEEARANVERKQRQRAVRARESQLDPEVAAEDEDLAAEGGAQAPERESIGERQTETEASPVKPRRA